jgi:hypothetical protein
MRKGIEIDVTTADPARLEAIVADRNSPQKLVWRARIILATADGCGTAGMMRRAGVSKPCVWRGRGWSAARQDAAGAHPALAQAPGRGGRDADIGRAATHWTAPAMAAASGLSISSVQRIWRAHGL